MRSAFGDGCGPSSEISYLQFEEVVTILTTQELHGTCSFIYRAKLNCNGFPCTCLQINKMSFFGNVYMPEGRKDTAEVKGLNWHHTFSFVNAFNV